MELKLSSQKTPGKLSPAVVRRHKLVHRVNDQLGMLADDPMPLPRKVWAWQKEDGTFLLPIKYGRKILEIQKGKFTIECENLDGVIAALNEVKALIEDGELDPALEKASNEIRSGFKKA